MKTEHNPKIVIKMPPGNVESFKYFPETSEIALLKHKSDTIVYFNINTHKVIEFIDQKLVPVVTHFEGNQFRVLQNNLYSVF